MNLLNSHKPLSIPFEDPLDFARLTDYFDEKYNTLSTRVVEEVAGYRDDFKAYRVAQEEAWKAAEDHRTKETQIMADQHALIIQQQDVIRQQQETLR